MTEIPKIGICSDASYQSQFGFIEYQVLDIETKKQLFHHSFNSSEQGIILVAEFLALMNAVKWVVENKSELPIYSDCATAIKIYYGAAFKKSKDSNINAVMKAYKEYIAFIASIGKAPVVHKWNTKDWGEIPADFGKKTFEHRQSNRDLMAKYII